MGNLRLVLADERLAVPEGEGGGDEDEEEEREALGPLEVVGGVEVAPRPRRGGGRGPASHGGGRLGSSGEKVAGSEARRRLPPVTSPGTRACACVRWVVLSPRPRGCVCFSVFSVRQCLTV